MATIPEIAHFIGDFLEDRVDDAEGQVRYDHSFGKSVIEIYIGGHKYYITIQAARN